MKALSLLDTVYLLDLVTFYRAFNIFYLICKRSYLSSNKYTVCSLKKKIHLWMFLLLCCVI